MSSYEIIKKLENDISGCEHNHNAECLSMFAWDELRKRCIELRQAIGKELLGALGPLTIKSEMVDITRGPLSQDPDVCAVMTLSGLRTYHDSTGRDVTKYVALIEKLLEDSSCEPTPNS